MLEMTCSGPGKNCNGTDKAINRSLMTIQQNNENGSN